MSKGPQGMVAVVAPLTMLLFVGCPKPLPTLGRVSDRTLASDAQKLGPGLPRTISSW